MSVCYTCFRINYMIHAFKLSEHEFEANVSDPRAYVGIILVIGSLLIIASFRLSA